MGRANGERVFRSGCGETDEVKSFQLVEYKLGKTDDVAVGTAAPCTWEGGEDSCCTDKVDSPCASGSLPCVLGEVTSLDDYTLHAVKQANSTDVAAIKADCGTAAADFETDAKTATEATD